MNASIEAVRVANTPDGPVPVVLLAVEDETDILPIFIGFEEATSIARGMDAIDIGRPLTHDLMLDLVQELGGHIDHVEISTLEDETYIADLYLNTPRDTTVIDARPSDTLALVSRTNAPIHISEDVFEDGRRPLTDFDELRDIREVGGL